MKIKVLFDKEASDKRLRVGWGVAFLVDGRILFDTGEDGKMLVDNMAALKIEFDKLEAVVISHDHWDHTGGLFEILKRKKNLAVYICPNFSVGFKDKVKASGGRLIEKGAFEEIRKGVYVTGEIAGEYAGSYMPEQALAVKTEKGISVITGCAHPGIVEILKTVRKNFPKENFYSVFGGFHLMDKTGDDIRNVAGRFKKFNVEKAGPTHCSGEEAEAVFRSLYKNDFLSVATGRTIVV